MENYLGNPNLKKANVAQEWTQEKVSEYAKCMKDPQYFIESYIRIVSSSSIILTNCTSPL